MFAVVFRENVAAQLAAGVATDTRGGYLFGSFKRFTGVLMGLFRGAPRGLLEIKRSLFSGFSEKGANSTACHMRCRTGCHTPCGN